MSEVTSAVEARVGVDGRFLALEGEPLRVRGVTYGTFAPRLDGQLFPERTELKRDACSSKRAGSYRCRGRQR